MFRLGTHGCETPERRAKTIAQHERAAARAKKRDEEKSGRTAAKGLLKEVFAEMGMLPVEKAAKPEAEVAASGNATDAPLPAEDKPKKKKGGWPLGKPRKTGVSRDD